MSPLVRTLALGFVSIQKSYFNSRNEVRTTCQAEGVLLFYESNFTSGITFLSWADFFEQKNERAKTVKTLE